MSEYIDTNSSQEIKISGLARESANEVRMKKVYMMSTKEKLLSIFNGSVREVHSVIRNNLYGDLKRFITQNYPPQPGPTQNVLNV